MTRLVTAREFVDWIDSQPDDRPVDMSVSRYGPEDFWRCGCLMIQFCQDVIGIPRNVCMTAGIEFVANDDSYDVVHFDTELDMLIPPYCWDEVRTFADAKVRINRDLPELETEAR